MQYECPGCHKSRLTTSTNEWWCDSCRERYPVVNGIPHLFLERRLGARDRILRSRFYDGFLGRHYQRVMPFLTLPVRPHYAGGWLVFAVLATMLVVIGVRSVALLGRPPGQWSFLDLLLLASAAASALFLTRHRYLLWLLILAIPVRQAIRRRPFTPADSFQEIHGRWIDELGRRHRRLRILDVSTGSCNSLLRHGWTTLDAEFTAVDLSQTMIDQGRARARQAGVDVEFALADAANLPFPSAQFDVVLNYGALNGYSDPAQALTEMTRVLAPGGLVVCYDEQLYAGASIPERLYFRHVLTSHDAIDKLPLDAIPSTLEDREVHQVYQFYYLFGARQSPNGASNQPEFRSRIA